MLMEAEGDVLLTSARLQEMELPLVWDDLYEEGGTGTCPAAGTALKFSFRISSEDYFCVSAQKVHESFPECFPEG